MKKLFHQALIFLLFLSIFQQNQLKVGFSSENTSDYNVSNGDVFIWQFSDLDFVDNTYYIRFVIHQIYENNSIVGQVERYYPFLNISTNDTTNDNAVVNPTEEIYLLPAFEFFGLDFNQSLFVNTSQLNTYQQNNIPIEKIKAGGQERECYSLVDQGKGIWIDKIKGVVLKVEYVKVYSFELVSWEDVNLVEFADEMHYESSVNAIFYFLISAGIAGSIVMTHLLIRRFKKRKYLKKKILV